MNVEKLNLFMNEYMKKKEMTSVSVRVQPEKPNQ